MARKIELNGFTYDLETPSVVLDGNTYSAASFTETEARIWDIVFRRLFALGNDPVSEIMRAFQGHLFAGARVAKMAFNEPSFAGVEGATTEMLMQELQAWHILRTTATGAETPADTWIRDFAAGEDNWIGWGTNYANPIKIDRHCCPVLIGLADLSVNRGVRAIKVKVGDTDHKPVGTERLQIAPSSDRVPVMPMKTLIFTPGQTVHGKTYSDAAVVGGKLVLLGITYGLGSYLTNMVKTTVN